MAWYYLYDNLTGKLISETDVQPDAKLTFLTFATRKTSAEMWDEVQKTFIARPTPVPVDNLATLHTDPNYISATLALSAASKTLLDTAVNNLLVNVGVVSVAVIS